MHTFLIVVLSALALVEVFCGVITWRLLQDHQPAGVWGWATIGVAALLALGLLVLLGGHRAIARWWNAPHPHLAALGNTISGWWNHRAAPALGRRANGILGAILANPVLVAALIILGYAAWLGHKGRYEGAFYLAVAGTITLLFHFIGDELFTKGWKWLWLSLAVAFFTAGFFFGYSLRTQIFLVFMILFAGVAIFGVWKEAGLIVWSIVSFPFKILIKAAVGKYSGEVAVIIWWCVAMLLLNVGPADNCGRVVWQSNVTDCQMLQQWLKVALGVLPMLCGWLLYKRWKKRDDAQVAAQAAAQRRQQAQAQQQGRRQRRRGQQGPQQAHP